MKFLLVALAVAALLATRLPAAPVWSILAVATCLVWATLTVLPARFDGNIRRVACVVAALAALAVPVRFDIIPSPVVALLVLLALAATFPRPDHDAPPIGEGRLRRSGWRPAAWIVPFVAMPFVVAAWGPARLAQLVELSTAGPVIVALLLLLAATGIHLSRGVRT